MGDADFARDSIQALNSHAAELGAMYRVVMTAATNRTDIPNIKHIFQEMAEASRECDELLEAFTALTVVAFEQGEVSAPRHAVIQRLAAVLGPLGPLPEAVDLDTLRSTG